MPMSNRRRGVAAKTPATHTTTDTRCAALTGGLLPTEVELVASGVALPRHADIPDLPQVQGELFFECTLFLYSMLALFLQYLNLYKTMWWLPNSHTHYAVKFHLIDAYLLSCVGLILGRRVTWYFLKKMTFVPAGEEDTCSIYWHILEWTVKAFMLSIVLCSFTFSMMHVISTYAFSLLLYLIYPGVVYLMLFYNDVVQWFAGGLSTLTGRQYLSAASFSGGLIDAERTPHLCTASAEHIRQETKLLYADLCERTKQSLFSAFTTAYFAVFTPCIFTPSALYVDLWWTQELVLVVFGTSFTLYMTYLMPLQQCDLLHRVASHLGVWTSVNAPGPLSSNNSGQHHPVWSEKQLYVAGNLVRHHRGVYRAVSTNERFATVVAEPGNSEHSRFHLSSDPTRWLSVLCLAEATLILFQFLMLVHSTDWQHIVTLVMLLFANYLLLFKAFKDKVILGRFYSPSAEDLAIISGEKKI